MKDAIEILDKYLETCKEYRASPETLRGVNMCLSVLRDKMDIQYTWQPSPDTPYKIELTKWIEGKHQADSPYSIFEAWQKEVCPRTTEEGEG